MAALRVRSARQVKFPMFDIGFTEIVVIGVVALIVVGPERLPRVARTAGALLGRLQRYVSDVKADINREIQLDELKKMQEEMVAKMREVEHAANKDVQQIQEIAQQTEQTVRATVLDARAAATGAEPTLSAAAAEQTAGAVPPGHTVAAPALGIRYPNTVSVADSEQ